MDNIDAVDQRLIKELSRDARQPYTVLSKKIGVNPVTTKRRVNRLINEGVVLLEILPDAKKLGYRTGAVFGVHVQLAKSESVLKALKSMSSITYIAMTSGRYDVIFAALFKSPEDLANFITNELASVDGIEWTETMMSLRVGKDEGRAMLSKKPVSREIDGLDKRLILALLEELRAPFAGLAEKLSISVPTVRQRVGRLVSEGIVSFAARPDPVKMGFQTICHIGLRVHLSRINEVQRKLRENGGVIWMSMNVGRFDIIMYCQFRSPAELTEFLQKKVAAIEGVERVETLINLQVLKNSFRDVVASL